MKEILETIVLVSLLGAFLLSGFAVIRTFAGRKAIGVMVMFMLVAVLIALFLMSRLSFAEAASPQSVADESGVSVFCIAERHGSTPMPFRGLTVSTSIP